MLVNIFLPVKNQSDLGHFFFQARSFTSLLTEDDAQTAHCLYSLGPLKINHVLLRRSSTLSIDRSSKEAKSWMRYAASGGRGRGNFSVQWCESTQGHVQEPSEHRRRILSMPQTDSLAAKASRFDSSQRSRSFLTFTRRFTTHPPLSPHRHPVCFVFLRYIRLLCK